MKKINATFCRLYPLLLTLVLYVLMPQIAHAASPRLPSPAPLLERYRLNKQRVEEDVYFAKQKGVKSASEIALESELALEMESTLAKMEDNIIEQLYDIINRARKAKDYSTEMLCYFYLTERYVEIKQYVKLAQTVDVMLKRTEELNYDYTIWRRILYSAAEYFFFTDEQERALSLFGKCIENPPQVMTIEYKEAEFNTNNTFSIYYYSKKMIDSAFYYLKNILESSFMYERQLVYQTIALSNIGQLYEKVGMYDEALLCYRASLDFRELEPKDQSFIRGIYTNLGNAYLALNNLEKTRQMIDSAKLYIPNWSVTKRAINLSRLENKYYTAIFEPQAAFRALDSMIHYQEFQELGKQELTTRHFLYAKQERIVGDLKLTAFKVKQYRILFISAIVLLLLLGGIIWYMLVLYRKKQNAYRKLTEKNIALSRIDQLNEQPIYSNKDAITSEIVSSEIDYHGIMIKVKKYLVTEKNFRDCNLTINKVSREIGINRSYISQTINKTTGENFRSYINTIRINEAIRLLSEEDCSIDNMEDFANSIGFTGRSTFYTNFKKVTGLAPMEFKKSLTQKELKHMKWTL